MPTEVADITQEHLKRLLLRPFGTGLLACLWLTAAAQGAPEHSLRAGLQGLDPLVVSGVEAPAADSPSLLQFWASWCHSCAGLMWDMDELVNANPGVQYLAISLDETPENARAYIARHALFEKYKSRYFHDRGKVLAGHYDVVTVPTILLIDGNGDVVVRKSGHLNSTDQQDLSKGLKRVR